MLRACTSFYGEPRYLPRERFIVRPAVYAVIRHDDAVLLVSNARSGRYYFPGGGIEAGESLAEALHREVKEEAGIGITVEGLLTAEEDFFYYDPADVAYHALLFYYTAIPHSVDLTLLFQTDDDEGAPQWVPVRMLQPEAFHNHGELLYRLITTLHN